MSTAPLQTRKAHAAIRKRQISLLLPPDLLRFANEQALARFTTRNQYIQSLLAQAYEQAHQAEQA